MKKEEPEDINLVPIAEDDLAFEPSGAPEEFGFQPDSTLSEKQRVWDRQEKFLSVYRTNGRLGKSARAIGLTRWAPNHWLKHDVMGFRERRDIAHQDWCEDTIECRIDDRLDTPEGNRGSDVLLMFQAKAEMPEKYREKVAVSNNDDVVKELLSRLKGLATPRVVEGTSRVVPEEDAKPAEDTA